MDSVARFGQSALMWCVKCGAQMIERDASLVCVATGSGLSEGARSQLEEIVETLVCDECDRTISASLISELIEFNFHP